MAKYDPLEDAKLAPSGEKAAKKLADEKRAAAKPDPEPEEPDESAATAKAAANAKGAKDADDARARACRELGLKPSSSGRYRVANEVKSISWYGNVTKLPKGSEVFIDDYGGKVGLKVLLDQGIELEPI